MTLGEFVGNSLCNLERRVASNQTDYFQLFRDSSDFRSARCVVRSRRLETRWFKVAEERDHLSALDDDARGYFGTPFIRK